MLEAMPLVAIVFVALLVVGAFAFDRYWENESKRYREEQRKQREHEYDTLVNNAEYIRLVESTQRHHL